ncbi:MAG: polymer-forming cytoskeletal protein, partial [Bacteroidota bacterium]
MFGNNKKEVTGGNAALSLGSTLNSLATGTRIEGTVRAENDIRIDGVITGKLYCSAKVIIGPSGTINGEVQC